MAYIEERSCYGGKRKNIRTKASSNWWNQRKICRIRIRERTKVLSFVLLKYKDKYVIISNRKTRLEVFFMKNKRINVGIIAALVIISLFNRYREVQLNRESKIADAIKFNTVDVQLEDIFTKMHRI